MYHIWSCFKWDFPMWGWGSTFFYCLSSKINWKPEIKDRHPLFGRTRYRVSARVFWRCVIDETKIIPHLTVSPIFLAYEAIIIYKATNLALKKCHTFLHKLNLDRWIFYREPWLKPFSYIWFGYFPYTWQT